MTLTADLPGRPAPQPGLHVGRRDRLRLEVWLWRLAQAMDDYPRRAAREIRRDLRASALDEASRVGMAAALRDLGRPSRLAAAYFAELDRPRPRWTDGAVLAFLVGAAFPVYLACAWAVGATQAVAAMGGGTVELTWLWAPVTVESTDDAMGVEFATAWQPLAVALGLGSIAFALGARVWRLWGTPRP
ncbi:hypothetical protein J1G42_06955 [Cellulomonas sp. zg-ZUI222]|uniref:Uncharacterized protein n=1 Tax=Cellulomonas wangleii TaxID=2816956 RepID=A0ABX8D1S1_9CELL|nr:MULTISPECIES: hypothetical protein [Cellulomonas]MBO0899699.1 hypothetical protein [Cellulomonas sp. zg-ZUI22]MBO0920561.1 hypothetical protein [Cellulomonas wangleii]MBO0923021.1 hypothetical protein [Cellulomonas wangleii]QVI61408.1 hypothetical protein KG103_13085 [Cellulomonas wangleii]